MNAPETSYASLRDVLAFLTNAAPSERITYVRAPTLGHKSAAVVTIRKAYNAGEIGLIQRRHADGTFSYIAERRRHRDQVDYPFTAEHL